MSEGCDDKSEKNEVEEQIGGVWQIGVVDEERENMVEKDCDAVQRKETTGWPRR